MSGRARLVVAVGALLGCSSDAREDVALVNEPRVLVSGQGATTEDCRTGVCRHNENCDLTTFGGALLFVHRTAMSQVLGPNSSLRVARSLDRGKSWEVLATIAAPLGRLGPGDLGTAGRDLRDPTLYVVGDTLHLKALTRLPAGVAPGSAIDTITVHATSRDGRTWSALEPIAPVRQSFWRPKRGPDGVWYVASYEDGDVGVTLFSSKDGAAWTRGPTIWDVAADAPSETELEFLPNGKMVLMVRMDGDPKRAEYLDPAAPGARMRTRICWSSPPYSAVSCPQELTDARLDGPISFVWHGRLFVIARKHLPSMRKRTALFELAGDLDGGRLRVVEHAELPSAGDTAYAGVVPLDDHRMLTTWYSSDVADDPNWLLGMAGVTDVWQAVLDLSALPGGDG